MRDIRTFCLFRRFIIARRHRRQSERSPLATTHVQPKARSVYVRDATYTLRGAAYTLHRSVYASSTKIDIPRPRARTLGAGVARPSALSSRRGAPRRELREYRVTSSN